MINPEANHPDTAVLSEIREMTGRISDQRTQVIVRSVVDAVALNPQPLPPRVHEILKAVIDAVALNPQPLPPDPPPDTVVAPG